MMQTLSPASCGLLGVRCITEARAGLYVTRFLEPLWLCEDKDLIGRQFFLMRRAGGTANRPQLIKGTGRQEGLANRMGMELARIYAIEPPCAEFAFFAAV